MCSIQKSKEGVGRSGKYFSSILIRLLEGVFLAVYESESFCDFQARGRMCEPADHSVRNDSLIPNGDSGHIYATPLEPEMGKVCPLCFRKGSVHTKTVWKWFADPQSWLKTPDPALLDAVLGEYNKWSEYWRSKHTFLEKHCQRS